MYLTLVNCNSILGPKGIQDKQYTHREILLNQTEIRLYLSFSNWFGTKRTSVWFQINQKMVNTIWFRFDLIIFRKDFSVCIAEGSVAFKARVPSFLQEHKNCNIINFHINKTLCLISAHKKLTVTGHTVKAGSYEASVAATHFLQPKLVAGTFIIDPFDIKFDLHLFLQAATVIGTIGRRLIPANKERCHHQFWLQRVCCSNNGCLMSTRV